MFTLSQTVVLEACIVNPKQTNKQKQIKQTIEGHLWAVYMYTFITHCMFCWYSYTPLLKHGLLLPVPLNPSATNSVERGTEYDQTKPVILLNSLMILVMPWALLVIKTKQIRLMFSSSYEQAVHQTVQGSSEAESSKHSGQEVRNFVSGTEVTPSELQCIEGLPLFPLG